MRCCILAILKPAPLGARFMPRTRAQDRLTGHPTVVASMLAANGVPELNLHNTTYYY